MNCSNLPIFLMKFSMLLILICKNFLKYILHEYFILNTASVYLPCLLSLLIVSCGMESFHFVIVSVFPFMFSVVFCLEVLLAQELGRCLESGRPWVQTQYCKKNIREGKKENFSMYSPFFSHWFLKPLLY
jgi:hypothetical protein